MNIDQLKYPIGKLALPADFNSEEIRSWIKDIAAFPALLREETATLNPHELEWKYRPDGWCIRQVVHHCADSHLNSQTRFKLALTEDKPTIRPYEEDRWAELPDMDCPIEWSLLFLEYLHKKWVYLLERLSEEDLRREYIHPASNRTYSLGQTIALYSWHCRHHLAHVRQAKEAKGKY